MTDYSFDKKMRALETIYRWYDEIAWSLDSWACEVGCSTCCTSLVISTTLEIAYAWESSPALQEKQSALASNEFSLPPLTLTTNERASLCIEKKAFEEDPMPSLGLPCPLLADERCVCYEARPLMCRMMFSSTRCERTGQAEMPPLLLSLNTVCLQLVEHLDQRGCSGYMLHLLPRFFDPNFVEACKAGSAQFDTARTRPNRPNPGFLLPPEDRKQIQSWLQNLHERLRHL